MAEKQDKAAELAWEDRGGNPELRKRARAIAASVWEELRKSPFDNVGFGARDILCEVALKGLCIGMVLGFTPEGGSRDG